MRSKVFGCKTSKSFYYVNMQCKSLSMEESIKYFTDSLDQALFFHEALIGNEVSQTYSGNKYCILIYVLNQRKIKYLKFSHY